jgi:hypothetical protein
MHDMTLLIIWYYIILFGIYIAIPIALAYGCYRLGRWVEKRKKR